MSEAAIEVRCPGCNRTDSLIRLVNSDTITYSAPTGCNGHVAHTIQWCQHCGTVRQYTKNSIATRVNVMAPICVLTGEKPKAKKRKK